MHFPGELGTSPVYAIQEAPPHTLLLLVKASVRKELPPQNRRWLWGQEKNNPLSCGGLGCAQQEGHCAQFRGPGDVYENKLWSRGQRKPLFTWCSKRKVLIFPGE